MADEALYSMVLRAQQLMHHKYPNGSLEEIIAVALKVLIEKKNLGFRAAAGRRGPTDVVLARATCRLSGVRAAISSENLRSDCAWIAAVEQPVIRPAAAGVKKRIS